MVSCDFTETVPLVVALGHDLYRWSAEFTVDGDAISGYHVAIPTPNAAPWDSLGLIPDYAAWVNSAHPQDHEELFGFGSMLYAEPEQRDRHRALLNEYVAQLGG